VEFAQSLPSQPISDAQVKAFAWYLLNVVVPAWPTLPIFMPSHAEVERSGETGVFDGKSDAFPFGDPRMDDLRRRIQEAIKNG
jgi:hypothetical protein